MEAGKPGAESPSSAQGDEERSEREVQTEKSRKFPCLEPIRAGAPCVTISHQIHVCVSRWVCLHGRGRLMPASDRS